MRNKFYIPIFTFCGMLFISCSSYSTSINVSDKVIGEIDEAFGPLNFKNKRNYLINSQDGIINAPRHLYNCLSNMKEIVIDIPYKEYNRKGILKAINSLYTNCPNLIIEPIKGITKAVKHTIKVIKNTKKK